MGHAGAHSALAAAQQAAANAGSACCCYSGLPQRGWPAPGTLSTPAAAALGVAGSGAAALLLPSALRPAAVCCDASFIVKGANVRGLGCDACT